jgi:hypothetical protein
MVMTAAVLEQPHQHRCPTPGDECLRVANRARHGVRVHAIGVFRGDRTPLDRLIENEADVLERATLPLGVSRDGERRLVRRT